MHDAMDSLVGLLKFHRHSTHNIVYICRVCLEMSVDASICLSVFWLMLVAIVLSFTSIVSARSFMALEKNVRD